MKELINIIVIIASILGGTAAFKSFHDSVRNVALEKSAKGLPSLERMSRAFSGNGAPKGKLKSKGIGQSIETERTREFSSQQ